MVTAPWRIAASRKPPYKVIAVDCDNTLWKGVCGEVGAAGIELTPSHLALQHLLVRQHEAGMLLCLCTKNNEADVDAVFEHRTDMPLRKEHFVAARINWNTKSANVESLAEELDLALDAFVFIDDSALECAEVQSAIPAVLVLQLPQATAEVEQFLAGVWAFDRIGVTELFEATNDERLVQFERDLLGETALVELEPRTDDDDRTSRVVDALAEQVFAEAALLALDHVGQRLQRAVARAEHRPLAAVIVE